MKLTKATFYGLYYRTLDDASPLHKPLAVYHDCASVFDLQILRPTLVTCPSETMLYISDPTDASTCSRRCITTLLSGLLYISSDNQ